MAFFQQLKLLLWKNGLTVIRQPLWSLTLICWPLIIFIIIAVTRMQFPPVLKETCFVGPRNLPSAGFFPFLQTLMCTTDSNCKNKSHLVDPAATKVSGSRRSNALRGSPLADLIKGDFPKITFPSDAFSDPAALVGFFNNVLDPNYRGRPHNVSLMNTTNTNLLGDKEALNTTLESMNLLKRAFCNMTLPMMNITSPNHLSQTVVNFCNTNETLLEVSLHTLNQILMELMLTKPDEAVTMAGMSLLVFDQLQNQTSLWESLLAIPELLSSGSVDEALETMEALLTNVHGALRVIESNFPEASAPLSTVHPLFVGSIDLVHYVQKWPGKDVAISLEEIVTLQNDSLSEMVRFILREVQIPLDKAIGLALDRDMVHRYICDNSSKPMWLTGACSTGAVRMILGWINPNSVAQQTLLAWSRHVAAQDVSFAKGLLHSLMGGFPPGGQGGANITRTRRSVETQPQNIEEELFLGVGQVAMEIIKLVPQVDMVVETILRTGFQSMKSASVTMRTVQDMIVEVISDADQLKQTYLNLLTNQSEASVFIGRVLDSGMEVIMKGLATENLTCEEILDPFEQFLKTKSIKIEVWRSAICQNGSALQQALLMDWSTVAEKAQELYSTITGQADYNITLPMILSEWHKLYNNSLQFGMIAGRLAMELGGAYWTNWMPDNSTHDVTGTLQQSVFFSMVRLGERFEQTPLWPLVRNYFHIAYWILNYRPGVTTQPANCFVNISTSAIQCKTDLNWPRFVQAMTQALMSPNPDILVNCLKGTVNLLQHVYSDIYKQLAKSVLKQEIQGGDALAAYLTNLIFNLDDFVQKISVLSNQNISNPDVTLPLVANLLQPTGLTPLLPLFTGNTTTNFSTVLDIALKMSRLNQHIFTFNETDPTMPELEHLLTQFLTLEGNLTMSLSHIMGNTLLTYSGYFHPEDVARLREAIKPFTNQTSTGFVEAILRAMELLKEVMDSPNGNPTNIILGYIRQLQEFMMSLYRLRRIQHVTLPNGQLSSAQITELNKVSNDFLNLLTAEGIEDLTQAGPDIAQDIIAKKFVAFLPPEVQDEATHFLRDFKALQSEIAKCAAGQNCLAEISEVFIFLDRITRVILSTNGNVTINVAAPYSVLLRQESDEIASAIFSLVLSSNDSAYVETFRQILNFIRLVSTMPNITVSDAQNALRQFNLTLADLNNIAALTGAANLNDLMVKLMDIINARQCLVPNHNQTVTVQCVMGSVKAVSNFLTNVPALRNEAAFLSLIPLIVNKTVSDVVQVDFSSNPHMAIIDTLSSTLANVKMSLQLNNLNTPEVMKEMRVLEGLIQLAANTEPLSHLNSTLMMNPTHAQLVYLKIVDWYLNRFVNITSQSSFSELFHPFFLMTQMQVTLQLAQTNLSLFVANQVESLLKTLQYPIDGAGIVKIGHTAVEILRQQFEFIKLNLEVQNNASAPMQIFNTTILSAAEFQVKQYLDLIQNWMKQPNVSPVLTSMLQWGSPSINISSPLTDIHQLLGTVVNFLTRDQMVYVSMISNVTQSLNKALMVAEQPGGLQSDHFLAAISDAVQNTMQILTQVTGPLPPSVQQNILEIAKDSIKLIVQPDMGFASSRMTSLVILRRAESVIRQTVPEMFAVYLLSGIKVVTTYFETISTAFGQDNWNQLILNEMQTLQSLLPPNSTVQSYVSVLINITSFVLESDQGIMNIWAGFGNATVENVSLITGQVGKLLSTVWPLIMGGLGSHATPPSPQQFAHLAPVLEQLMTGTASKDTWNKLEKMLEVVLSTLKGTQMWNNVSAVVPLFEKILKTTVQQMQAENVLILSFQTPVVTLMREIAQSANTSRFNLSQVSERMPLAIERTMQAAQQANGTLECHGLLKAWQPVREAAGLSHDTLATWCNVSLQPVVEAYTAAETIYTHLNMSNVGVEPLMANATAARIVKTVQSFYRVNINRTLLTQQLIMTFSGQFSSLAGQPLSPEAQLYWYNQLETMQLQHSLSSIKMLSAELLNVAPYLHPYIRAMERALSHILDNYHLTQNSNSAQRLFTEAASIILSSANITSFDLYPMIWGNFSGVNEASVAGTITNAVKAMIDMKMFGSAPAVYQALGQILASNETSLILQKVTEISAWLASTQASGLDLLTQALPKIHEILRPLLSALTQMSVDMPANMELFGDLAESLIAIIRQLVNTSGPQAPMRHPLGMSHQAMTNGNHTVRGRHRREAPTMPPRYLIDDFMDLLYIDYPVMFQALSVLPTQEEMMETVHVFFANPDLNVVVKGVTRDMTWGLNASREETIDAALGMLSILTLPGAIQTSSLDLLANAAHMLPEGFPFSALLKNFTRVVADESHEILILMQNVVQTAGELLQINMTDPRFTEKLDYMKSQVCILESSQSMHLLMVTLSMEPGQLCSTVLPSLETLIESLMMNVTILTDAIFEAVIGDPRTYKVQSDWMSALSQSFNFSSSSMHSLKMNTTSPGPVTVGEILRNETAFILDVQQHMDLDPAALRLLLGTTLPNSNLVILSWVTNLHHCDSAAFANMKETDAALLKIFCSMSPEQWYSFLLLLAQHVNVEKAIYRMVLSEELQGVVAAFLRMAEVITDTMNKFLPAINQLQQHLMSISDLSLVANDEFKEMTRGQRSSISSKSTFVTLSRALCSKGILALFGISQLPIVKETDHSLHEDHHRKEMITRFKIPPDASPFCTNMYLDMVNTTGGAIAWAFLKPMLMGHILYSPDTPVTRAIMEKANATLQQFANLRDRSEEWLESSKNIVDSAQILSETMPMLQNSLGNSFVKNFIEMQTDINVGKMKETLSNFSNMTDLLKKNKHVLKQIDTLSTLMVELSSCIKFDRYRGYDSEEELNAVAQELAKNRDLYASVIFKLSDNDDPSRKRQTRSSSSLPPKVSYTIRMHMDNVMRTDRVRNPYFVKDNNIWTGRTMRYNRGFIYLQENIDRAIIETQTGHRVTEPAVQLQPFPYPCHHRDEYLEAISFVFPLMLMMAWVLFVADFVKKLVHERELRLHEYMKMMGVNPLSHFFAWFVECATYLVLTIFILTLVLKYGNILPSSDGFLLFLYFCDYGLSVLAFSFLISSFFDKTYIAGLSGSLIYVLCFFPFIVVMAGETKLNFSQKSALSLFSPTCFSYASQYISRYEAQGEGIHWSNSYTSPIAEDTASFGWLCWLMLIDSFLYFIIGAYIRMVFPGKYGIPAPWYFPFTASFWADLCCCIKPSSKGGRGLFFSNIMQKNHPVFFDDKGKGQSTLSSQAGEDFSHLPMGVALHGLSKIYGERQAIENLNVSFYEGHVTSLLGHNGAGKTTTMSLLTGLYAPSSGSIEVYGQDMQANIEDIRKELGVCMQYDVLFDHMTTKEHLLLYGQIKAPHWSHKELREQVRTILEETGMYAHRHKRVGTLSGGMKRKLSISIAFIGGSRLVVLDEPTTGVDPCSRRSIWDIIIQHKKNRTIIMSTHHLDEAEVLSDRIAFLERGGLKCCGSPFYLKDKLGHGYKLTLTRKTQNAESDQIDSCELKSFIQAHVPEARLKEAQGGDVVYSLPPFSSSNASSYRSLLTALDANLDALQLGGYGISDTTLEEVFLQLAHSNTGAEDGPLTISETVSETDSMDSQSISNFGDKIKLTGSSLVSGLTLAWQQMTAILIKRFHHSRRDWKGLIAQILLPVVFVICAMGLGSIKSDLRHYPELVLSPALYKFRPSYSFFSNQNPNSSRLTDAMMSFPGIDNACLNKSDNPVCTRNTNKWSSTWNSTKKFSVCKCTSHEQICGENSYEPPHKEMPSAQVLYNLSGVNVENYLVATANNFIRNRYGGFSFGMPLPDDLQMDVTAVPKNRTLTKVWFNPEGHHTMPAYLNSLNNLILSSNLPADKDPREYAISVSSHPYFGREDDEDTIVQGMLQIMVVMCVLTGYSITTASFAIYEVNEHHSGSKRLQHIAGVGEPFYWAVNFLYDMAIYMFPVTLTIAVAAIFQLPAFTDRQNLGAVALLLVLFGFATFPWMYLLSGIFRDAEMAFITYVCINLFISMNTILSTSILYFLGQISASNSEAIQEVFKKLCYTFHIFPQFNFGNGLMTLARKNIEVQLLSGYGIDAYQNPFSLDGLGGMFISSFILGLVFFTLRILLNKYLMRKVWRLICGRKTVPQVSLEDEDEDVATEHLRVSSGAASSDVLQVNQLTKVYQHLNKKVHAVKRLSVGIPAGECFGLLGVNGAGKTTTFKMLTGDVSPTDGTAQIRERDGRLVDIMECRDKGINIGYCPQVDALDNLLTGEEHLYFYGRIRGISKRELDGVVNYLLRRMELNYHRNIVTDGYSCGTRRKLSTALALIGHPQILLLDEPSSGMDPHTKRHLWKIISEEVKGKCAVVLTSHSMEECEALCSRLAIMVKGQFRCLGSLQHIKNRFGSGFTVKMYLAKSSCDTEAITGFMQHRFPSTYLKDQHSSMVEYHVPVAPGGVADIFDQLESNKNALQIKHFSVSQTTLDEVFINFALGNNDKETTEEESKNLDSIKAVET